MLTKLAESTKPYETIMKLAVHLPNGQTLFRCPYHGMIWGDAVQAPQHSCEYCWIMYFLKLEAITPANQREQLMDNLVREMTQIDKTGAFDVDIPRSPLKADVTLDPTDLDHFTKGTNVKAI